MVCSSQVAGSTWSPPILIASQWSGADQENAKLETDQEQMRIGSRGKRSWSDQGDSGSDQEERRKADDEGTRGSRSRNNWPLMVILSRAAVVRRQTDDWRTTSLPFATIPYHTIYHYHTMSWHTVFNHITPYPIMCHAIPCHAVPRHTIQHHKISSHVYNTDTIPYDAKPYHTAYLLLHILRCYTLPCYNSRRLINRSDTLRQHGHWPSDIVNCPEKFRQEKN